MLVAWPSSLSALKAAEISARLSEDCARFRATHATTPLSSPVPKAALKFLLHGRGKGEARFSDATGALEVVNRRGKVLW